MNNLPSIQERLQLKRVPLDKWSTKEKLCLASAVACSGDQNWMSVSRALKVLCGTNRPGDWFSQKSCAAQYGKLLENVETPKRKKRTASERDGVIAVETPSESILRKLTQERIIELKKLIQEEAQQYTKVKEDIILIQSGVTDEKKLREMWKQIEIEKAQKEREQVLHAQWLKEREEKKLELERQWRPMFPNSPSSIKMPTAIKVKEEIDEDSQSSSKSGTSPLLTSLLKNPTANATGIALVQTTSGKAAASPTITNLLTGNSPSASNIQTNKVCSTIVSLGSQAFEGNQLASQSQGTIKSNLGNSSSLQTASNQSTLIDTKYHEHQKSALESKPVSPTSPALEQNEEKTEDIETDPDNIDPAKDLMAVFQELMPEELDEILNDNNGMILEDEILENVVDSIMEEEAESFKEKEMDGLPEPMASPVTNVVGSSEIPLTGSKNEEATPEVTQVTSSDLTAIDISPSQTTFEEPGTVEEQEVEKSIDETSEKVNDTQEEKNKPLEEIAEKASEEHSEIKDDEIVPVEDSRSHSPLADLSSIENKETAEVEMDDDADPVFHSPKEEESETANFIKADVEEDSEDKPLASLDTSSAELRVSELKQTDANSEGRIDKVNSTTTAENSTASTQESMENKEKQMLVNDEEVARAKKEALEKLASEYDFKDDDEPIVPLSIQKSKEDKQTSEEDIFMDAQENLDEPEEQMDTLKQKKCEESTVTVTDTDDDSLIEMKISKTKRDYSRRRPADDSLKMKDDQLATPKNEESEGRTLRKLRDRDRSESPFVLLDDDANDKMKRSYSSTPVMDSIPNSPASSEDRDYRAWKKYILSIHSKISSLRYASMFLKPLPDDQSVDSIFRPMDLSTIKRNIENGNIRTTAEYQRDLMLLCTNAIMLNRADIWSPTAARVLLKESTAIIETSTEVNKNARDKDSETRSGSASKRNSRKGNTRSSTSAARN